MGEPGRTCACTPRSLLVPAGGVATLDPSQRVSAKELQAKDREWQRQRQDAPRTSTPQSSMSGALSEATTATTTTTVRRDGTAQSIQVPRPKRG